MKISELIEKLKAIKSLHGDLPVYVQCDWQFEPDDISVTDDPSNQYDDTLEPKRVLI